MSTQVKTRDLREKVNTQSLLLPSFEGTLTEATKESMETKPSNNNKVHNFMFFSQIFLHYVASSSSSFLVTAKVLFPTKV